MIKSIAILFCVTNSFFSLARCKTFRPCELAKVLLDNDISKDDIATWLCIARYESTFNSSAVGHMSGDGSLDHGIFQINDRYWCTDADDDIKACGITCKALEDDDLTDDIACARRIYRQHKRQGGNGWTAWAVYPYYCTNREKNEQRFLKNNNCSLSSLSSLTSKIQLIPVAPVVNQVNPFTSTGSPNSIFNSNNHFTSPSPTVFNSNKFSPFKSSVPPVTTNYPVKQSSFSGSYQSSPFTSTVSPFTTKYPVPAFNRFQLASAGRPFSAYVPSTTEVSRKYPSLFSFPSIFRTAG